MRSRQKRSRSSRRSNSQANAMNLGYETLEPRQLLAVFYVSNTGDDTNAGTAIGAPFETIQRAATAAQPGDTVLIRGGVYREQVSLPRSGSEDNPITFAAFGSEDVTVTATDLLTGFTPSSDPTDNPNIYEATLLGNSSSLLSRHELTVFVNGSVVQEATSNNNANYLNANTWDTFDSASTTVVRDNSLIGSTKNLAGSFIRIRTSDFTLETRRIASFNSGNGQLTLTSALARDPSGGGRYLLHDSIDLLDSAGEWHFNEETDTFSIWAPGGGDPDNDTVEVKRRGEAFDLNGRDYIHFRNLRFTGGDLDSSGSDGTLLDGIHIIAPDRIFGPEFGTTRLGLLFDGDNNIVRNSEFEQIWSGAIRSRGANNQYVNNFFHDTAFNGSGVGGIVANGDGDLISHNTFTRSGRAAIGGDGTRNVIQFNDFSQIGLVTTDVGAIYFFNQDFGGSEIHHNIFHDIGGNLNSGVYIDNFTTNVTVHHNVFHRISPFGGKINLPSSFILYYNNTIFDSGRVDAFAVNGDRNAYGNKFFNNIYGTFDGDLLASADPVQVEGNFVTTNGGNFVNANAGDFRLVNSSGAVDAGVVIPGITDGFVGTAPDAGAYELGEDLFEVGHNFSVPPSPTYDFVPVVFSNRIENGSFESGFAGWSLGGSPTIYDANSSNFRDDALGRFGANSALLTPGNTISQTISGLQPNTSYTFGGWGKLVGELLEAEDATSSGNAGGGNGPGLTSHRGETALGQLVNNDFVQFADVDFGSGGDLYNQLQLAFARTGSGDSVQIRLDSVNGPIIDTAAIPANLEVWTPLVELDISGVTGVRDVFLVFQGGGNIGLFGEGRLVNTQTTGAIQFFVANFGGPTFIQSDFGAAQYPAATERVTFTTGPTATSATVAIVNPAGGQFDGYVDFLSVTETPVVSPTIVDLTQTTYRYDLQPPDLATFDATYQPLTSGVNGDISWSAATENIDYGAGSGENGLNRDVILKDDGPATLEHRVTNGIWRVLVTLGDVELPLDSVSFTAEGTVVRSGLSRNAQEQDNEVFEVEVSDGSLSLTFDGTGGVNDRWAATRIILTRVGDLPVADPLVVSEVRDAGSIARPDQLTTLAIGFNQSMEVATNDLFLRNETTGAVLGNLPGLQVAYDQTNFVATWDFSQLATPLEPAFYSYIIGPGLTSVANGQGLTGDGPSGLFASPFYLAVPGDANLDGTVDVFGDGFTLLENLGNTSDVAWSNGDFNADGMVDVFGDGFILLANLGQDVIPSSPALVSAVVDSSFSLVEASLEPSQLEQTMTLGLPAGASNTLDQDDAFATPSPIATPRLTISNVTLASSYDLQDDVFAADW